MDAHQHRLVAGRYRLLSPVGAGGMGTVWRGRDELLGRDVAVKEVLFPRGLSEEDREVLRERTRREARAAARLDHPSAVTVYDVVQEDGSPYLVMELVEARTLSEVLRTDGPLSPQRTAQVGLALLGALETAHAEGIVHRDVKPGNVMLCPDDGPDGGRVVLTDFGIASTAGDSSITSTGLLLGSPSYIAPERARGQPPAPASDLWSLGATLFTAVEGRPPYDGGEPLLTVTAVVTGEHAPYVAAGPLEPVLEGLLERDPAQRLTALQARAALLPLAESAPTVAIALPSPAAERRTERTTALSARDLRSAVEASDEQRPAASPAPAPAPAPAPRRPPARPPRRRSRAPLVLLAAIVLVAVAIGAYLLAGGSPAGSPTAQPSAVAAPSPSPSPTATAPAVPAGWTRYEDEQEGWTVGVPPGYARSERNGQVQFRNEELRRTLRIEAGQPRGEPVQVLERFSRALDDQLRDYERIRLDPVTYLGQPAAELEFTFYDQVDLRVLNRTFVGEAGEQAYSLYWQTNARDFDEARPVFDQVLETFRPR